MLSTFILEDKKSHVNYGFHGGENSYSLVGLGRGDIMGRTTYLHEHLSPCASLSSLILRIDVQHLQLIHGVELVGNAVM